MDQVQAAEDRLSDFRWLTRGEGTTRTRRYEVGSSLTPEQTVASVRSATKNRISGSFTSSTGIGTGALAGDVGTSAFDVSFYDPTDVTVVPWTRATIRGEVIGGSNGGSIVRLWIRPGHGGLIFAGACALIGLGIFVFGIVQFAAQQWWKSFGIAVGISVALSVIPCGLLWWAIREGRANERQLLTKLGESVLATEARS